MTLGGPAFAQRVRSLRGSRGLKAEPAIAASLGLPGDPYAAVDALAEAPDDELVELIRRASRPGSAP